MHCIYIFVYIYTYIILVPIFGDLSTVCFSSPYSSHSSSIKMHSGVRLTPNFSTYCRKKESNNHQWRRGRWFSGAVTRGPAVFPNLGEPRPIAIIFYFVNQTKHKSFCKFIITRVILLLKEIFCFKNTPFYFNTFT